MQKLKDKYKEYKKNTRKEIEHKSQELGRLKLENARLKSGPIRAERKPNILEDSSDMEEIIKKI